MSEQRKILLLGGSGFIGKQLAYALANRGWQVTVPSRRPHRHRALLVHPNIRLLEAGKVVITANKALLAEHGPELFDRARQLGRSIAFEASVAGGVPIIASLSESLTANRIEEVVAILNGTSNFILTQMEENGSEYAATVAEAQQRGYAEADPTFDNGGHDTAHKLAILTTLAFGTETAFDSIYVEGIESITPADIEAADDLGYRIKLLGVAMQTDSGIEQRVHPTMVDKNSAIAD